MHSLSDWLEDMGISKINPKLIKTALTHSSYKGMGLDVEDNERLEYLGDAVLDLINAELYFKFHNLSEGVLTELRKNKVNNRELARLFDGIKMNKFVYTANNFHLTEKVKADFIEALFGAIFLDSSYDKCFEVWINIESVIFDYSSFNIDNYHQKPNSSEKIKKQLKSSLLKNAKSTLLEFCQSNSLNAPFYKLIGKTGPDHDPEFIVQLWLLSGSNPELFRSIFQIKDNLINQINTKGYGKKKKDAEMDAARKMCDFIGLKYS